MLVIWYSGSDSTSAIYAALIFTNFWLMFVSPENGFSRRDLCARDFGDKHSETARLREFGGGALGTDGWLSSVLLQKRPQLIRKGVLKVG